MENTPCSTENNTGDNTEESIEQAIQRKNLTAPRITPQQETAAIVSAQYHRFPGTQTTVCCITLRNGFTVIGQSACVFPENYDQELGERIAFEDAKRQIGQLEGYLLAEKRYYENGGDQHACCQD